MDSVESTSVPTRDSGTVAVTGATSAWSDIGRNARVTNASVAWALPITAVEAIGVSDGIVFVATDSAVLAVSLVDGSVQWTHEDDDYWSDGGASLSISNGELWVFAPYNADLRLNLLTGETITSNGDFPGAGQPVGFVPLNSDSLSSWTVENTTKGTRAVLPDGSLAWELQVQDAGNYEGGPVVQTGSQTIVAAANDFLYALDT